MALEHQVNEDGFNELNESVREHYTKDGENYYLQATGLVPKAKVDEFRNNNISLKAANEKYETDLSSLQSQLEAASKGVDSGKVDALVEEKLKKRIIKLNEDNDRKVTELTEGKTKAEKTLSSLLVNDAVQREAIAAGVRETALDDVMSRANKVFKVVEGKATPFDGEDVIYGADGVTPMAVKDWLAGQAATAPHLFKESKGAGANNKNKSGGATPKQISRTDFEAKNAGERMAFVKSGGKVAN